jgi:hypothetical protein
MSARSVTEREGRAANLDSQVPLAGQGPVVSAEDSSWSSSTWIGFRQPVRLSGSGSGELLRISGLVTQVK